MEVDLTEEAGEEEEGGGEEEEGGKEEEEDGEEEEKEVPSESIGGVTCDRVLFTLDAKDASSSVDLQPYLRRAELDRLQKRHVKTGGSSQRNIAEALAPFTGVFRHVLERMTIQAEAASRGDKSAAVSLYKELYAATTWRLSPSDVAEIREGFEEEGEEEE
ncbi:hypothetical protein HDU76_011160 [Blyttiomyces sp. JEL0837]|nr:hypothetical protein HDU76_011160 [Blyttiomyces sp. JEL0837]